MSEEDREAAKQLAVEAVKEHLDISDKTRVRVSIRNAVGIGVLIVGATVSVCTYLNRIETGQDRIEAGLNHKVGVSQFVQWADDLDHANRQTVPLLVVPRIQPEDKK